MMRLPCSLSYNISQRYPDVNRVLFSNNLIDIDLRMFRLFLVVILLQAVCQSPGGESILDAWLRINQTQPLSTRGLDRLSCFLMTYLHDLPESTIIIHSHHLFPRNAAASLVDRCDRHLRPSYRIQSKLLSKLAAKREASNLIAEMIRFRRVSPIGVNRLRNLSSLVAPSISHFDSICLRMVRSDLQVQALRRNLHSAGWAVNDDYRLLRRVVEVERRLVESMFFEAAPPEDFDESSLIERLLLTEALMDLQRNAFID